MTAGGRVTIVGHDASRSGAPLQLETSLRWASTHLDAELSLVLLRGGPLVERYRSRIPVRVLDDPARRLLDRLACGVDGIDRAGRAAGTVRVLMMGPGRRIDEGTIVANTLAALPAAAALAAGARLVAHVHELDHVADRVLPAGPTRRRLLDRVDLFIAAGHPVARMLDRRWGIDRDRIAVVEPFIDPVDPVVGSTAQRAAGEAPLVVSVGATSHRKGTDRFVDLMAMVCAGPSAPEGAWIGGDPGGTVGAEMRHDLSRGGLEARVGLVGERDDVVSMVSAADVVVSTAREDPFPLGVLEAAALDRPVVAFDSGGAAEVLRASGNGDWVVPVGDTIAMHDRVATVLAGPDEAARRGRALGDHVRSRHLTAQVAPDLWALLMGGAVDGPRFTGAS
ncbi:MAG: glycosyltransferase family 4 protein [Microthrixaceae bacterium]